MNNSTFQFEGYRIQKSIIEVLELGDDDLSINFELNGNINKAKGIYLLTLKTKINNKTNKILIDVTSVGKFSFPKENSLDELSGFFYTNAPAILFPYVRAYIATLTNLSGIKPINLPTLNLTDLVKILKENTTIE